jgi:nitrate reductase gamma subunit
VDASYIVLTFKLYVGILLISISAYLLDEMMEKLWPWDMAIMDLNEINGWRCVLGGFMVHLVLGSLYCWSNISMGN